MNEEKLGIEYNVKQFGYAPITSSIFGSPIITKKNLVSATNNVEQSAKDIYGDGLVKISIQGTKKRSAEITVLQISKAYAELALGYKLHPNGGISDTGVQKPHCFFYLTEEINEANETTDVLHYFYNSTASTPSEEHTQNEDDITVVNLVIPYKCIPSAIAKDKDGKEVSYFKLTRTEENKSLFDSYTTKVILPNDTIAVVK